MRALDPVTVDRVVAALVVGVPASVYVLPSQSAASFPTYLLAIAVIVRLAISPRPLARTGPVAMVALMLLVYFSTSVWWSSEFTWRGAFSTYSRCILIAGFCVGVALALGRSATTLAWLGRMVTFGAAAAAAAALIGLRLHPPWDNRLVGFGQLRNSVVAALTFGAALLIALDVTLNDTKPWRIGAACAIVPIVAAVVATGSRNGYAMSATGVWVALFAMRRPTGGRRVAWFVVPAAIAAVAMAAIAIFDPSGVAALFPRGDSFRVAIWSAEWQRYVDGNAWFGLGILTSDRVVIGDQTFAHPHSLYLASALQGGLVGLVLLLSVLGCTVWKLVGSVDARAARLGLSLIAAGSVAYLFDGWELIDKVSVSWLVIWLPVGIACAVGRRAVETVHAAECGQ